MIAYLLGLGIVCGAVVSWWGGPEQAPSLLARWIPGAALALFAALALSVLLASEILAALASHALYAVLGFFAGGLTQATGMALARAGLGLVGSRSIVLLVVCSWVALFVAVGMTFRE